MRGQWPKNPGLAQTKMTRVEKYISFKEISPLPKTRRWEVWLNEAEIIGEVKWRGNWRKYAVELFGAAYYDWDCLRLLADFCEQETLKQLKKL